MRFLTEAPRRGAKQTMKILLYNPDNGVTRNFMPHLWMFLLQSLTPPGHEVLLIDGNARPMNEEQLVSFIRDQQIGLVGIGAMTRMVARAYLMADAIRAAGVPVVMGGPHVTEVPDEALGRDGGPRHADAVALGEADETWPPGLPVFGQLTPFPATPLYDRLLKAGRLTRPKHWLEFAPYQMANTPLKMTIAQTHAELDKAWTASYSPERNASAIDSLSHKPIKVQVIHLAMRLFFRGIYFPQMTRRAWVKLVVDNRRPIYKLVSEGIGKWRAGKKKKRSDTTIPAPAGIQRRDGSVPARNAS
jgi:hypothetical protein